MRVTTLRSEGAAYDQLPRDSQLVFWVGPPAEVGSAQISAQLHERCPRAHIIGWSASGEVMLDDGLEAVTALTAISFDATTLQALEASIPPDADLRALGAALALRFPVEALRAVCLIPATRLSAGGLAAAAIVEGFARALPPDVVLFGAGAGVASYGAGEPVAGLNGPARSDTVVALGFYGENFEISSRIGLGWRPLGPLRRITRSEANLVYEFDGKPALDLYLSYAGVAEDAFDPHSSRFAFFVSGADESPPLQAIVNLDRERRALALLTPVPTGAMAQLAYCSFDELIDAGAEAAREAMSAVSHANERFAFIASCVIRRGVLGQRVNDELDAVWAELRGAPALGFFSYGEIGRSETDGPARLMAQALAVTVFGERADDR